MAKIPKSLTSSQDEGSISSQVQVRENERNVVPT
jgi:hypothetical protein